MPSSVPTGTRRRGLVPGVPSGSAGTLAGMTDTALESLSDAIDQIDPDFAHQAVSWVSIGLGGLALVAPQRTAALFGVKTVDTAVPLLVRMIGVRNALAGLRTLQAEDDDELRRALSAGLVLGAVDATAVVLAARRGAMSKSSALGALLVLGGIAALGVAASRD